MEYNKCFELQVEEGFLKGKFDIESRDVDLSKVDPVKLDRLLDLAFEQMKESFSKQMTGLDSVDLSLLKKQRELQGQLDSGDLSVQGDLKKLEERIAKRNERKRHG